MKRLLLTSFFSLSYFLLFAQSLTGSIQGKVMDSKGEEPLIGATVVLSGTIYGSPCNADGEFILSKIPEGIYTAIITLVGYQQKIISDVQVEKGKVTQLYTILYEESTHLNEVLIAGERTTDSELSVISEVRLSQTVANGISAEQISKTQDSDGAQVLRRIPGISIVDDRFVMIRGLSERYNSVLLNGSLAPSTEVDTRAFSFDALPSSVIDRIIVSKSGSYELPGDFAGGIIEIFTKKIPVENFTDVTFKTGYHVGTTGKTISHYPGGKSDWLGYDDGTRKIPVSFPSTAQMQMETSEKSLKTREMATKQLSTTWLPETKTALPDCKLAIGIGRRWEIKNRLLSNLTSVSYSNTQQLIEDVSRNRYQRFNAGQGKSESNYNFHDNSSSQQVRIGILTNWTFRFNNRHRIEFRNLFNQLGSSQTVIRMGSDAGQSPQVKNYSLYYESRRLYSGQLAGFHKFKNDALLINWLAGYNNANRQEPDFRRFITSFSSDLQNYHVPNPSGNNSLDQNARFFSSLKENTLTFALNVERKIKLGKEDELDDANIKCGLYIENKKRDFAARNFVFKPTVLFDPAQNPQLNNPMPEALFTSSSIGTDKYLLEEGTKSSDQYDASSELLAGYLGGKFPYRKWILSTGLRAEFNVQKLQSAVDSRSIFVNNSVLSLLPSLNLSYTLTDRMLIRVAYSSSVNRPEFREYAPFLYYDFSNRVNVQGNDSLQIPRIYNLDLKWEFYPSPEEVISVAAFYKRFANPIELKISGAANSSANWQPINAHFANSFGIELEIRKSMNSIFNAAFLKRINALVNASYIFNRVNLGNLTTQKTNRTMMNQSPYLINLGLIYNDPGRGWQASLLYNIFGARLFYAGDVIEGETGNYPDAFELPRHQLDFSITKSFNQRLEISFGIQDLLNAQYRFYQDSDRNSKIEPGKPDEAILKYRKGQNISISLKYNW